MGVGGKRWLKERRGAGEVGSQTSNSVTKRTLAPLISLASPQISAHGTAFCLVAMEIWRVANREGG